MKHFAIIFFLIVFSAVGFLYTIKAGWYPAVIVNSKIIWAGTINKETKAALYYYEKTAGINPDYQEIKKAAIENMIEKILISKKLQEVLNQLELTASLQDILDNHLDKPQLEPAAALLYGLKLKDFYNLVLVPQAERELLEKKLTEAGGGSLDEWLQKAKQSASIVYITKEF